ncbi:hypothetical protein AAG906_022738 [Vitis piasezkii]
MEHPLAPRIFSILGSNGFLPHHDNQRRFFFGPHHRSWQPFSTLRRRFTRRSFKEQIAFHSSSHGCYAKFWSISDTPLSLSKKEREFALQGELPEGIEIHLLPQLHLPHHSLPHQQSRGWPSLYPNIESSSQAQQAAILRQLQAHFDLPQAEEPSTSTPAEPHSQPAESHPQEAPADAPPEEAADPSA